MKKKITEVKIVSLVGNDLFEALKNRYKVLYILVKRNPFIKNNSVKEAKKVFTSDLRLISFLLRYRTVICDLILKLCENVGESIMDNGK